MILVNSIPKTIKVCVNCQFGHRQLKHLTSDVLWIKCAFSEKSTDSLNQCSKFLPRNKIGANYKDNLPENCCIKCYKYTTHYGAPQCQLFGSVVTSGICDCFKMRG